MNLSECTLSSVSHCKSNWNEVWKLENVLSVHLIHTGNHGWGAGWERAANRIHSLL